MITSRAIEPPQYFNGSNKWSRWYVLNYQRLVKYFTDLGGDMENVTEFVDFCHVQFDRQTLNLRDEKILHEAQDQTARNLVEINEQRAVLTGA